MHELAITRSVVDLVVERLEEMGGRRAVSVRVRVGLLSAVVPDAMRFCFELATAGTTLEGAELVVEEVPGRLLCRDCGTESTSADLVRLCPCGSAAVDVVAGGELTLASIELVRESSCA